VDRLPKWAQALVLVVVIGGSAFWLYYRFVLRSDKRVRMQTKAQWDSRKAFDTTKELREKGKQRAGAGDYVVEAKHDPDQGANEYVSATIRKTTQDGKVTEEITASRMTVTTANDAQFSVVVFDATRTTYDEAGNAKTETMPGRKELLLYAERRGPAEE